jgi:hypothetical protein
MYRTRTVIEVGRERRDDGLGGTEPLASDRDGTPDSPVRPQRGRTHPRPLGRPSNPPMLLPPSAGGPAGADGGGSPDDQRQHDHGQSRERAAFPGAGSAPGRSLRPHGERSVPVPGLPRATSSRSLVGARARRLAAGGTGTRGVASPGRARAGPESAGTRRAPPARRRRNEGHGRRVELGRGNRGAGQDGNAKCDDRDQDCCTHTAPSGHGLLIGRRRPRLQAPSGLFRAMTPPGGPRSQPAAGGCGGCGR